MILAGDVGGTNTRLAYFETAGGRLQPVVVEVFPSGKHASLEEIIKKFRAAHNQPVERAGFGVAGPVRNGVCVTPNLAWQVHAASLASELGIQTVRLVNDLEANAYGIAALGPEDFVTLNEGARDAAGNAALISAGTGLGEAALHWVNGRYRPIASEGGHADFAPRNETEIELLRHLLRDSGHVSYERVLSGPGLYNIYKFLRDTGRAQEPAWLAEEIGKADPSAVISRCGLEEKCEICTQALDVFVGVYGAEAGNLALRMVATGGLFVGGGIAPKIVKKLQGAAFLQAFANKGRMAGLLQAMPVRVIMNDKTALLGAARVALDPGENV